MNGGRPASFYLAVGGFVLLLLTLGFGVWAGLSEIAGAVVAPGTVVVESSVRKVQPAAGGVVRDVLVRNGDRVGAGDVLLRLDETVAKASAAALSEQRAGLLARAARLEAERDGRDDLALPEVSPDAGQLAAERSLFQTRRALHEGQKAELKRRIVELSEQGAALDRQIAAKEREIGLLLEEIEKLPKPDERGVKIRQIEERLLIAESRSLMLRREAVRLEGERGQLRAQRAQMGGRVSEIKTEIERLDQERTRAALAELQEVRGKLQDVDLRSAVAREQLQQLEIKSPAAGIVHELTVSGAGAVIAAGETLMQIVPEADRLVVEAHVEPGNIDQVIGSRSALVRFPSFNARVTPEVPGALTRISADLSKDQRTGLGVFVVRVEIADADLALLGPHKLVPGMPAEVQIATGPRSALSYILKPLADQLARTWRER